METDITAMLPQTAPDAVTKQALAHVDAALGQRSLYLIGAADFETARHAAGIFAGTLRASPAYSDVSLELSRDPAELDAAYGPARPEERSVGKGGVSRCSIRWVLNHQQKKITT